MKITNSTVKELVGIEGVALLRFIEGETHYDIYHQMLEDFENQIPGDLIRMAVNSAELLFREG